MKKIRTILLSIGLLPLAMWAQNEGEDMTSLLINPDFEQSSQGEQSTIGWNVEPIGNSDLNKGNVRTGGTSGNTCYEAWNSDGFDIYQVVEGAPVGVYEIEVQGFYRYLRDYSAWNAYQIQESEYVKKNGTPVYVYLNNNATPFGNVFSEPVPVGNIYSSGTYVDPNDEYWYPDQMWSSAEAFLEGMYKQSAYGIVVKEGDVLRLGVKGVSNQGNDSWVIWDNFRLIYHGYDAQFIAPLLQTTIEECESFLSDGTSAYARNLMQDAINGATTALETDNGETMFNALNALYDAKEEVINSRTNYTLLSEAIIRLSEAINNAPQDITDVVSQAQQLLDEASLAYSQGTLDADGINEIVYQIDNRIYSINWAANQPLGDDYFAIDNIWYRVYSWSNRTVWVSGYEGSDGRLSIPSTLEQYGATFSVTGIDMNVFHYNDAITSVTIPATMTELYNYSDNPFSGCINLKTIRVDEGNPRFDSRNDCNAVIETATNLLCIGCNNTVIPESVTAIGRDAFYGMTFSTITIPSSVQSINYISFGNCNNLKYFIVESEEPYNINYDLFAESNYNLFEKVILFVPEGSIDSYKSTYVWNQFNRIVAIGSEVPEEREYFDPTSHVIYTYWTDETTAKVKEGSQSNWTAGSPDAWGDLVIPETIAIDGKEYTVTEIGTYAFLNNGNITSVTLPATVETINNRAFFDCWNINSITLSEGLITIGDFAFGWCSQLQKIHIPASVTYIDNNPFRGCPINSLTVDENNPRYDSRNNSNAIFETSENKLIVGNGYTTIPSGITTIGSYAFGMSGNLTSIIIPEGVERIEKSAFWDCWNMTSVSLPQTLNEIEEDAFYACSSLQSISIPESVTSIGYDCFGNTAMTSFTFPQNITGISWGIFENCTNLQRVEIPANAEWIDGYAFYNCPNLNEVVCYAEEPPYLNYNAFLNDDGSYNNPIVYVPAGSVEKYQQADVWSYFTDIRAIDEINMLYIADDVTFTQGENGILPISLKNSINIKGLQFDVVLPEGLYAILTSKNKPEITVNNQRAETHTVSCDYIGDGSIRVVMTSLNNNIIEGTDGVVINMSIEVPEWSAEGQYDVTIKNVVLTNTGNKTVRVSNRTFTVNVIPAGIMGDVNGDKTVDVTDVVLTIDYILEKYYPYFREQFADMNSDGYIDITDVVREIDVILGKVASARAMDPVNTSDYTAFQMDFTIPAGYTLEGVSLTEIAKESHSLAYNMLDSRRCRVIVCSPSNEALPGTWNEVIRLHLKGHGTAETIIDHAVFVTIGGERHELNLNGTTGIFELSDNSAKAATTFDLQGRRMNSQLKKGLYIIDGKKAIVK